MSDEYTGQERRSCTCVNREEIILLFAERDKTQAFRASVRTGTKILGAVALVLVLGSYSYTTFFILSMSSMMSEVHTEDIRTIADLKSNNIEEHNKLHRLVNISEDEINQLQGDIRVSNDRYLRLIVDLGKIDGKLSDLFTLLDNQRTLGVPPVNQGVRHYSNE